ncbi:zinc finger CCHC domain-containing protein 8-like isoform X1 [Rhinichthys klamathensis goyatoka]|uniref:zinc finger CCHC domain-containing protein 8-like isoform X1 n=2 Tax=Rhinichthys klamathensis goyatoka TaxID=3034132 RepID=UPI0024B5AB85|nr:zinc finger CCHC domain-containing protein 8-like isoform X1 [Rhinichthys klamathensis goyatoka]
MAAVDFGDVELFEQFEEKAPTHIRIIDEGDEEEGESSDRLRGLRQTLEVCEETVERLKAENEELKRKLNILSRPTGIKIADSKTDGPLCQVNYGNSIISKQCRKDIEDFIYCLVEKRLHECNNDPEGSALHVNPHHSSFVMEESYKAKTSSDSQLIKNAFSIIGSVLYFTNFCVDKLGQPLLNENPQLTEGWEVPKYQQVFGQIIALEGQEVQVKEKRPRPCCFNCCSEDHQLRDCPKPKDMARINEKRKEFSQNSSPSNQRYHAEEVEERFAKYKPGIMSEDLLDALGITVNTLPPFIYRMRELGYPPGWLKEAEMENSGLILYDGSNDEDENHPSQNTSYDVSKLVDFPGFNVSTPPNIRDDYRSFGSIPMQPQQWKQNFAAFLSSNFPSQATSCSKRRQESESTPQKTKKLRTNSEQTHQASDMEIESDHDTPQRRSDGFQFHPPLPPGCSSLSVPPPLPLGTPPTTPPVPKGTPPATPPTSDSPSTQGRGMTEGEESEDGLTLEELEEQQRLLWAALEKADTTTNSDSEAGASGTPIPSSPSVVTSLKLDTEEEGEKMEDLSHAFEIQSTPTSPGDPVTNCEGEIGDKTTCDGQEKHSVNENVIDLSDIIVLDEIYEENGNNDATNETSASPQISTQESNAQVADDTEEPAMNKVAFVPHRSRFAEGIIPFEDTPEFTEVAEATGVYLKIRDLLKGSPRNQAKNKK